MSIDDLRTNVDTLLSNVDLSNIDIEDIKISDIDTMKTKLDNDVANAKSSSSITPEEVKELEDKLNDIKTIIDKLKDFKKKADLVVLDNKMIENINKMIAKNPSLASSYQRALDSLETKKTQHEADLLNPTLEYNDALVAYQNKYGVKMNRVVPTPPAPSFAPPTPSTPTPATPSTPPGPIPGAPSTPSGPTEPLPTPTTPLTSSASIQYYVDNGLLPKMSESDLIATCKRLGIKGKDGKFPSDLDFELDSKQMSRLVNAREVRDARLKAGVVEKQQEVADRYKDLVQDNIQTFKNAKDKDTKRIIYGSVRELNDSRHEQENKIAGINEHDVKTYHAFGEGYLNDRSRDASERVNKKQEKNDKELDETYREADRISNELNRGRANKTLGAITEIRLSIRLGRLENRIERLQKKQGKLNDRQTKIVNKSTDRYVKKVTKQQRRYKREQTRLDNYVNHTNAIDQRTADLSAERTRVNNNMTMSGLNALDRTAMRLNGAALTARLAALRGRKFVLDTNEQIVRAVTSGRTM